MRTSYFYDYILKHKYRKVKSILKVGEITVCDICRHSPCDPRCPNAPEPPAVYVCSGCGEMIRDGDDYWDVMGEQWCEECIDEAKGVAVYDPY